MTDLSETDLTTRIRRLEDRVLRGPLDTPEYVTGASGSDVAVENNDAAVAAGVKVLDFQNALGVTDVGDGEVVIDAASGSGGYSTVVTKASDYTMNDAEFILGDASGGTVTLTLPTPMEGMLVGAKKIDTSGNNVVVQTPNTETIDGQNEITISSQYTSREISSDGQNYYVL